MKISIITPAFRQTDWLRLCVASVADQIAPDAQLGVIDHCSLLIPEAKKNQQPSLREETHKTTEHRPDGGPSCWAATGINQQSAMCNQQSSLQIEHIIQDAGTLGIVEFVCDFTANQYWGLCPMK